MPLATRPASRARDYLASVLSQAGSAREDAASAAAQVHVDLPGQDAAAFYLTFTEHDLLGCGQGVLAAATAVARFDGGVIEHLWSGRVTGTQAVMSGRVSLEGSYGELAGLRRAMRGPRFRAWVNRLRLPSRAAHHPAFRPRGGPPLIVILGATNDDSGGLSPMARARAAKAIEVRNMLAGARLVLTGGFGAHFNTTGHPHWRYLADHLSECGVPPQDILAVTESKHTYEDILYLREVVALHRPKRVVVVTSDYHAARVRCILDLVLPTAGLAVASSDGVDARLLARLAAHDEEALARTVVAAALFGPDQLNDGPLAVCLGPTLCWKSV
ncbi:ElyC/SanA/YdcF family protein [Nonomuraea sp. NPDC050394]|uniref:ElyC/SanA/YdcF family protein n=1 Tax=Nonomuraea sp. NPDC050394 TaxID=3364363 RepID=UPI0037B6E192